MKVSSYPRNGRNGSNRGRRNHKSLNTKDMDEHSQQWLAAIKAAIACITNDTPSERSLYDMETSLSYLSHLESLLEQKPKKQFGYPPDSDPPSFSEFQRNKVTTAPVVIVPPPNSSATSVVISPVSVSSQPPPGFSSKNPFAAFMDDSNDSDDDDDDNNQSANNQPSDEGGDEIVLDYRAVGMDVLRILVRLSTSQSDLQAAMAATLVHKHKDWTMGSTCLQYAILHVHKALELADARISKWYEHRQDLEGTEEWMHAVGTINDNPAKRKAQQSRQRQQDLQQDADIVHVCIQSLVHQRQKYLSAAQREVARLRRRLEPQWEARDQARRRMGDRWTHNPHPKNNFAEIRRADEEALRKLEDALELLDQNNPEALQASAALLMTRLTSSKKNRYNGQRPTDLTRRVSGFPDAMDYGWTFTGSADSVVEFFEKKMPDESMVKLDFYFTTGTVKTSLDHPTQGKTQLFASKVTPDVYVQILQNPRVHTNVRYKKKRGGKTAQ